MEAVSSGGEIGEDKALKLKMNNGSSDFRAEIDTSAPFQSVKQAVTLFGGLGYWKPTQTLTQQHDVELEEIDIAKMEQQAAELEKDLILKERETLNVLKDLESTKMIVDDLKNKLQKGTFQVNHVISETTDNNGCSKNTTPPHTVSSDAEKENVDHSHQNEIQGLNSTAPAFTILKELKQAKVNLSRTTTDLADIRTCVDHLNKKLDKERNSLEKTRERLTLNFSKASSLEDELNRIREKLQLAKDAETNNNNLDISMELQRLSSEAEQYKKMGEEARSQVSRAMSEIEQTKARIKTAEIRLIAARKMKEAARASEAVALAEIKALSNCDKSVTLSHEDYSSLVSKARDAEKRSQLKVINAMNQVDEANVSKVEMLRKVEEATAEVKTSKKALEVALNRVESANQGKLAVEEALRKWRSDNGRKRRTVQNCTKFKNPCQQRRESSHLFDVNGLNLGSSDGSSLAPVLKATLSIGQILSRKLLVPEELESGTEESVKRKVSLGQMLSKKNGGDRGSEQIWGGKRKKFGFGGFSLRLRKQQQQQSKKKKGSLNLK